MSNVALRTILTTSSIVLCLTFSARLSHAEDEITPCSNQSTASSRIDAGESVETLADECTTLIDGGEVKGDELLQLYKNRASIYARDKDMYDEALDDYNKVVELEPLAENYGERGKFYLYKLDKTDEAISDFNKVIETGSVAEGAAYFGTLSRAMANVSANEFNAAIEDFGKAFEEVKGTELEHFDLFGAMAPFYGAYALSYYCTGQYDLAVDNFTKGIKSDKHPMLFEGRARAYIAMEKYDLALEDLEKALEVTTNQFPWVAHDLMAQVYEKQGNRTAANRERILSIKGQVDFQSLDD